MSLCWVSPSCEPLIGKQGNGRGDEKSAEERTVREKLARRSRQDHHPSLHSAHMITQCMHMLIMRCCLSPSHSCLCLSIFTSHPYHTEYISDGEMRFSVVRSERSCSSDHRTASILSSDISLLSAYHWLSPTLILSFLICSSYPRRSLRFAPTVTAYQRYVRDAHGARNIMAMNVERYVGTVVVPVQHAGTGGQRQQRQLQRGARVAAAAPAAAARDGKEEKQQQPAAAAEQARRMSYGWCSCIAATSC